MKYIMLCVMCIMSFLLSGNKILFAEVRYEPIKTIDPTTGKVMTIQYKYDTNDPQSSLKRKLVREWGAKEIREYQIGSPFTVSKDRVWNVPGTKYKIVDYSTKSFDIGLQKANALTKEYLLKKESWKNNVGDVGGDNLVWIADDPFWATKDGWRIHEPRRSDGGFVRPGESGKIVRVVREITPRHNL